MVIRDERKENREGLFWWLSILGALGLGIMLYVLVMVPGFLRGTVELLFGDGRGKNAETMFLWITVYGRDFFWGYALVFAVGFWFRSSWRRLRKAFVIVFIFEIGVSVFCFVCGASGFDWYSYLAVFAGNFLASVIVLFHERALV